MGEQVADAEFPELLRGMAHDLANLLTVVHGSLELADRHAAENPALARLLNNIRIAAERADGVIDRLRELGGDP